MALRKLAEFGVKLGAATLVGLDELQHKHTEEKPRKSFLWPLTLFCARPSLSQGWLSEK